MKNALDHENGLRFAKYANGSQQKLEFTITVRLDILHN